MDGRAPAGIPSSRALRASSLSVLLVAFLHLGACEAPPPDPDPGPGPAAMEEVDRCVNREAGYAVEYPAGWHVNPADPMAPCSVFHPEPFQIPPTSEVPIDLAVILGVEPVVLGTIPGQVPGRIDLERRETTVAGREAVRLESETTGEGLHDAGIRMYQCFVAFPGGRTMAAATHDVGDLDFHWKREILDAMMARLTLVEDR